ncbi:lipid II flippase MurJ [Niabella beijingensis]|uniref:lipid II flippase MurJ n=1 Tax=Niabella beijingensis TaxID=2872700 RepID=UPI001CC1069D|nr:lipid II flippase MurJ [Niabella beijingensis]MBZ4189999.1 hypothetical protein [Niabella beijingensis]
MKSKQGYFRLSVLVIVNLAMQFIFQWYTIVLLGAGAETDAFFGAMTLPTMILSMLSSSLSMVLVPVFSEFDREKDLSVAWDFFCAIGLVFIALGIILFSLSSYWVTYLLPGFKDEKQILAVSLTKIQLIGMVMSALLSIVWAAHASRNKFVFVETTAILANMLALLALFLFKTKIDIYLISWISIFRITLQVIFLSGVLGKPRIPNFKTDTFKVVWKRLRPLLMGNLYYKTDPIVDKYFLSQSQTGRLTIFNLAQQIYAVGNMIFIKVFVNTMVPKIAVARKNDDLSAAKKIYYTRLWLLLAMTIICSLLILLFGRFFLSIAFKYKNFSADHVYSLWNTLLLLSGLWIGGVLGSVTSSTFYSLGDTVTPTRIGAICFTLFIPLKIFVYYKFGFWGLGVAISSYYMFSFAIQAFYLTKRFRIYDK